MRSPKAMRSEVSRNLSCPAMPVRRISLSTLISHLNFDKDSQLTLKSTAHYQRISHTERLNHPSPRANIVYRVMLRSRRCNIIVSSLPSIHEHQPKLFACSLGNFLRAIRSLLFLWFPSSNPSTFAQIEYAICFNGSPQ